MRVDARGCTTVTDAAKALGVHHNTIRNWANTGFIEVERLPGSGFRRVPIREVKRLREAMKTWPQVRPGRPRASG